VDKKKKERATHPIEKRGVKGKGERKEGGRGGGGTSSLSCRGGGMDL